MWHTGRRLRPGTSPNGITAGEWLCPPAITSDRAR